MAYFFVYLYVLAFASTHHSGLATRFLPTIVWDHLNPLLSCKCNWLVIPYVDQYDQQQFTCPTTKIYANLLDGYFRPNTERNENVFRRKWPGTKEDLQHRIRNGSIDSFCDPTSSDTTKLHTCKNGATSHVEVTYKYSSDSSKMYAQDNIYVFFNNGDDGRDTTLESKVAKCTTFFAVYVTTNKKAVYGMNFDKPALTGSKKCKLSTCALSTASSSVSASPTTVSSRYKDQTSTEQLRSTPVTTSTILSTSSTTSTQGNPQETSPATTTPGKTPASTRAGTPKQHAPQVTVTPTTITRTTSINLVKTVSRNPQDTVPCTDVWLNDAIFIWLMIAVAFVVGVLLTIFAFAMRNAFKKRGGRGDDIDTIGSPAYGSPQTDIRHQRQEMTNQHIFSRKL